MATGLRVVRAFHVTSSQSAWFMAPLARVVVAVGARAGRFAWSRMSKDKRQAVKASLRKRSSYILSGVGAATACGIGYYFYHIEDAPITGRSRFMMINRQKLFKMLDQEKETIVSSLSMGMPPLPVSHPASIQVTKTLQRIISVLPTHRIDADIQDMQWTLYVLDSPDVVNAVCLPSGEIFVHSGLLEACHNQDELAFILSHEVAHVLMNHGGEILSNRGLVDFFQLFLIATLWIVIPSDLASFFLHKWSCSLADVLFHLPYSRQLEEEADTVGLMLLSSACFQPSKSVNVWEHFPSSPSIEYLSTHPLHEKRLVTLRGYLPAANKIWETSQCHKIQAETSDFKNMVNKTLKNVATVAS